jgi:octaprenyl-diphosphate synthase
MREGKLTLPIIYAANTHGDERIHDMIGRLKREGLGADEINELIEFAKRHGGIDYAERTMQDYRKKALDLLPEGIDEDIRKAITSYIDVVINRKK